MERDGKESRLRGRFVEDGCELVRKRSGEDVKETYLPKAPSPRVSNKRYFPTRLAMIGVVQRREARYDTQELRKKSSSKRVRE